MVQCGSECRMASTPTQNVRLTITVTPEVHAVYQRLADSTSTSLGKTMGEWLESTIEGAQYMAGQMEQARAAPQRVMREIHAYALGVADETGIIVERMRQKGRDDRSALASDAHLGSPASTPPVGNTGGKGPSRKVKAQGIIQAYAAKNGVPPRAK